MGKRPFLTTLGFYGRGFSLPASSTQSGFVPHRNKDIEHSSLPMKRISEGGKILEKYLLVLSHIKTKTLFFNEESMFGLKWESCTHRKMCYSKIPSISICLALYPCSSLNNYYK